MTTGRPRYFEPTTDEECHALGKDLIEWALELDGSQDLPKTKRTHLGFWYSLKKGMLREQWKALIKRPLFRPYYETAQLAITNKLHNEELKEGLVHRYLRLYDRDLVEEENEQAKYLSDLRKEENSNLGNFIVETINYANNKNNPSI